MHDGWSALGALHGSTLGLPTGLGFLWGLCVAVVLCGSERLGEKGGRVGRVASGVLVCLVGDDHARFLLHVTGGRIGCSGLGFLQDRREREFAGPGAGGGLARFISPVFLSRELIHLS